MSTFCNCEAGLSNLGTPSCESIQSVTKKLIYVPIRNAAGTKNSILSSDVIDEAYLTAKINETDESARWYFSPFIENVDDVKGDSTFESLNSGTSIFIQEGARTFNGVHIKEGSTFLGKLKSGRCVDFGVYMIDINGSLTGSVSQDGLELFPVAVDKETFNPVLVKATDTTVAKVSVSFEFSRVERDENLRTINASDISADLLGANGLLDATATVANDVSTGGVLNVTVSTQYGSFGNPIKVEGLLVPNFSLLETTNSTSITIDTVTEDTPGAYTLTYTYIPTGSDKGVLTVSKVGFEIPETAEFVIN